MNNPSISQSLQIEVTEPEADAWIERAPAADEMPVDNQFYARSDNNEGTLFYNGTLSEPAEAVFLKLYADDKLLRSESRKLDTSNAYAFTMKLKPGLIKYRIEFGSTGGGTEKVLHTASNIVCGDAYIIEGQSNALATDTGEESPPETSDWIRSYGNPNNANSKENLWCN